MDCGARVCNLFFVPLDLVLAHCEYANITSHMNQNLSRRDFLRASTTLAAAASFGLGASRAAEDSSPPFKTKIHKALIRSNPTEDELKQLKDAGFEGVEGG